ncbi:hypothetical protein GGF50DRAFT_54962 [Schizophyllum commune]
MPRAPRAIQARASNLPSADAVSSAAPRSASHLQAPTTPLRPPSDTENIPPPTSRPRRSARAPLGSPKASSFEGELREKLASLELEVVSLRRTTTDQVQKIRELERNLTVSEDTSTALQKKLLSTTRHCNSELDKADKRHTRLKLDKKRLREEHAAALAEQEAQHAESCASHLAELQSMRTSYQSLSRDLTNALAALARSRESGETHRQEKYALAKKVLRCLETLRCVRLGLLDLQQRLTFDPKDGNHFSWKSRWITRQLGIYGVKARYMNAVISDCASLFGIILKSAFLGQRTAGRILTGELGIWTLLQLAREVKDSMGFICSSDGTSHKKIQYEATHISHAVPTYAPDVDDNDKSTWIKKTRFVAVKEAVRHDAISQHKGKMELGKQMTDLYNRSPLSVADGSQMRDDAWSTGQLGQSKDHAADGLKETELARAEKEKDVKLRLAEEAYSKVDWKTLLDAVFSLTEEEVVLAIGNDRDPSSITWAERFNIATTLLKTKLGEEAYARLRADEKDLHALFIFGGCCSHKDLNAFKYGTDAIANLWNSETLATPPPTLLPNKSLDSILTLGDKAGVDARLKAMDMSASGGPKLAALLGAIFRNKDDKKGYQQTGRTLLQSYKVELHGKDAISYANIADTSNTRFQSAGKAAVELIVHDTEYRQTIETICNAKVKAGANHMEAMVLKAMDCRATLMDLIAMGTYMICVSEPYMIAVREGGDDDDPPNLLLTVDLHRRIADFCEEMANSPRSFFDKDTPLLSRTLDGNPPRNERFIAKCLEMFSWTGDDVFEVIAAMFRGAAKGWRKFTSEFAPGGPIDQLTPYQRSVLFIPATNDHNEGILGSLRIFLRRNPCSTTATFNALERMRRNNTESFITKVSTPPLETWVMREGRAVGVKQDSAVFNQLVASDYRAKADAHVLKVTKKTREEKERLERLRAVGLVTEVDTIGKMTLPELREQLEIYIDIIKDPVLDKKIFKWNMVKSAIPRKMAVIAALGRYQTANPGLLEAHNCPELLPSPMDIDGELVEGLSVGINLEDEDYMDEDEL